MRNAFGFESIWQRSSAGVHGEGFASPSRMMAAALSAELRERIFEPFFSSKAEKGTGLGLWASRAIVLRNGGTLHLRSAVTGVRRGTSVSVFLPTAEEIKITSQHSRKPTRTTT
jgi:Histidine kinase-, DNA gyrase B-, and HSP90-like ATPase